MKKSTFFLFFIVLFVFCTKYTEAQNISFPADAVIDVTLPPYNADKTGVQDATSAINMAMADHPNEGAIIYLPQGTYLISNTISWGAGSGGNAYKNTILHGQGIDKTIIKLRDNCSGFSDPTVEKTLIFTGGDPAQRFRNAIHQLTINTGSGNPGATGMQFCANNQGGIFDVKIKSGDGTGKYGINFAFAGENGPLLVKNVEIEGFNIGIYCAGSINSQTFSHIILKNQIQYGLYNNGQVVSIEDLISVNSVPALYNLAGTGVVTLIGAKCTGYGAASSTVAIKNEAIMYARSVWTNGYQSAISNTAGNNSQVSGATTTEWASHDKLSLNSGYPSSMLNLPIKQTPVGTWDDISQWQKVGGTSTADVQNALNSGKSTIYFPRGSYNISGAVTVPSTVRRIIGCEATIELDGANLASGFLVNSGGTDTLILERFNGGYASAVFTVTQASSRVVAVKHCANWSVKKLAGSSDLYLEDVVSNPFTWFEFHGGNVWARQLNPETGDRSEILNDGANLWALGVKIERSQTITETKNGGKSEILGFFAYSTIVPVVVPAFINNESSLSAIGGETCFDYNGSSISTFVQETKGGVTTNLAASGLPARAGTGHSLPFYVGGSPVGIPIVSAGLAYVPVSGISLNQSSASIGLCSTLQLVATISPSNASNKYLKWSSSSPAVATVSSYGNIMALASGTSTITVTSVDQSKTASCVITVTNGTVNVSNVVIAPKTMNLFLNETGRIVANIYPICAQNRNVSWSSSNTSVASVDATGLVTAKTAGTANITVTTQDGGKTDVCALTSEVMQVSNILKIEAETYNTSSGSPVYKSSTDVGGISNGSWFSFSGVNFTSIPSYNSVLINAASGGSSGNIEVRLDGVSGALLATITITGTGSWSIFQNFKSNLSQTVTGTHDLYFVGVGGNGGICNIDYIQFATPGSPTTLRIESESFVAVGGTSNPPYNGGSYTGGWDLGDWTQYDIVRFRQDYKSISVGIGMPTASVPAAIKFCLDSINGNKIGEIVLNTASGDWGTYQKFSVNLNQSVTGIHNLYAIASQQNGVAGIGNIDYFEVSTTPAINVSVTSVSISPTTASVSVGATTQLTATVAPADATNQNVTWSTSNASVATVSSTGVVTGVAVGSATINVTTVDGNKTAACSITVNAVVNVPVTSVSVSPTTASVGVGATTSLTATIAPSNATNQNVTWSTSNSSIATVSTSGGVTGVAAGTATITVTTADGNKTATCSVTVSATIVSVTGVLVSPTTASVSVGATTSLIATVAPSNATNQNVTWSTSNSSIATVNNSGVVTGVAAGSANITVTTVDGNKTATCVITVPSSPLGDGFVVAEKWTGISGVTISSINWATLPNSTSNLTSLEIPVDVDDNYGVRIRGYIIPSTTGTYNLYISSDNNGELWLSTNDQPANKSKIATVTDWTSSREWTRESNQMSDNISLTAGNKYYFEAFIKEASGGDNLAIGWTGPGISAISVIDYINISSYSATTNVVVTGVSLNQSTLSVNKGSTATLTATVAPSNATNQSVSWASSDTNIATASSSGVVTAVNAGSATITVTTADGNKTAACSITVNAVVTSVTVSPTTASVNVGATTQLTATVAPADATNQNVTWSTSNSSIATVNNSGVVTGVAAGSANITVTTVDGNKTATCAVTVSSVSAAASATFIKTDATTKGTWKGIYGADGYNIANDATSKPTYATATIKGASIKRFASSTTDVRALQKASGTDRISASWQSYSTFNIDVNISDGNAHTVSLYTLDWARQGKVFNINVVDAANQSTILDSRSCSSLGDGVWYVWSIKGHVIFKVTSVSVISAVNGIFFGEGGTKSANVAHSIDDASNNEPSVKLYPNPTNGNNLNIEVNGMIETEIVEIVITDMFGRVIELFEMPSNTSKTNVNINKQGVYIVTTNIGGHQIKNKLIVN